MMDGTKGFEDALTGEQKIRNFNINFEIGRASCRERV